MNEELTRLVERTRNEFNYLRDEPGSEVGLFLKVMEQTFTVVNQIAPVTSTRPLEIFYYLPVVDELLETAKLCICMSWLQNIQHADQFDLSVQYSHGQFADSLYKLPMALDRLPTAVQRDQLWDLGVNTASIYVGRRSLVLAGDVIWKQGERVQYLTVPPPWSSRATMLTLAQQISYAEFLTLKNPQWLTSQVID